MLVEITILCSWTSGFTLLLSINKCVNMWLVEDAGSCFLKNKKDSYGYCYLLYLFKGLIGTHYNGKLRNKMALCCFKLNLELFSRQTVWNSLTSVVGCWTNCLLVVVFFTETDAKVRQRSIWPKSKRKTNKNYQHWHSVWRLEWSVKCKVTLLSSKAASWDQCIKIVII